MCRLDFIAEASQVADGILHGNANGDRSDDACAEVQGYTSHAHDTKEKEDRKKIGQQGKEANLSGKEHERQDHEDHDQGKAQAGDLTPDDVLCRFVQENETAGRAHRDLRRKMFPAIAANLLSGAHDIAGAGKAGAHQNTGDGEVRADPSSKGLWTAVHYLHDRFKLFRSLPEGGYRRTSRSW